MDGWRSLARILAGEEPTFDDWKWDRGLAAQSSERERSDTFRSLRSALVVEVCKTLWANSRVQELEQYSEVFRERWPGLMQSGLLVPWETPVLCDPHRVPTPDLDVSDTQRFRLAFISGLHVLAFRATTCDANGKGLAETMWRLRARIDDGPFTTASTPLVWKVDFAATLTLLGKTDWCRILLDEVESRIQGIVDFALERRLRMLFPERGFAFATLQPTRDLLGEVDLVVRDRLGRWR